MAFLTEITADKDCAGVMITGYEGTLPARFTLPDMMGGIPVTGIGKSAFARRGELVEVTIPSSLRVLRGFAFYHCDRLMRIALTDGIDDYSDGVIRQCPGLRELAVTMSHGNYRLLSRFLSDTDERLRLRLTLPGGELCVITIPSYVNVYREDTMARAIHPDIQGCGMAYRECIRADHIDLTAYDDESLFIKALSEDEDGACDIALGRLMTPVGLRENAKAQYRDALENSMGRLLPRLIGDCATADREYALDALRFIAGSLHIPGDVMESALTLSAGLGDAQVTGILMQDAGRGHHSVLKLGDL